MGAKTILEYESEIRTWEKQISETADRQKEIKDQMITANSASVQLEKEREDLSKKIKTIGFFKFKERYPLMTKMRDIKKKIKEKEIVLGDLENSSTAFEQQINELQTQINASLEQKQRLQKEKEVEDKASKGDPHAQYEMGLRYRCSDFGKALDWLEKASRQGHREAQSLKTQIENEKIYFKVCNDTAFTIVEFRVFHNSENTHNWQGTLLSTVDGGGRRPVLCSLNKGSCKLNPYGSVSVQVQYVCNMNGMPLPAAKEQDIRVNSTNPESADTIYLDRKFF